MHARGRSVGLTYFKRFRMELDLNEPLFDAPTLPKDYELVPWTDALCREHAMAKYQSFYCELDANVFPCLGRRDGCVRLMREITRRTTFVPEATWLLRYHPSTGRPIAVGTVQGLRVEGWGAIQNLGVTQEHRGYGLGTILMAQAATGFRRVGLAKMHLEVTTDNTAAVRLYRRMGFRQAQTVFKAAEVSNA